jgi:hypothetical protein
MVGAMGDASGPLVVFDGSGTSPPDSPIAKAVTKTAMLADIEQVVDTRSYFMASSLPTEHLTTIMRDVASRDWIKLFALETNVLINCLRDMEALYRASLDGSRPSPGSRGTGSSASAETKEKGEKKSKILGGSPKFDVRSYNQLPFVS